MLNECDLIQALKSGDINALGVLYDRYRHMVYRTALVITGDQEAASDLLQDVFLRLYRFADHIDCHRPLRPWLHRMTANLSYTWVKRNHTWLQPIEELVDWLASFEKHTPSEMAELQDDWERVQRAILNLPLQQRVVVVLYYLNDLSLQEIAQILDIPEGTVKSRLHYGRQAMKQSLGLDHLVDGEKVPELY